MSLKKIIIGSPVSLKTNINCMYLKMAININGNSRGKPFVPSLSIVSLLTDQKINTEKNEARQNISKLSIRSLL